MKTLILTCLLIPSCVGGGSYEVQPKQAPIVQADNDSQVVLSLMGNYNLRDTFVFDIDYQSTGSHLIQIESWYDDDGTDVPRYSAFFTHNSDVDNYCLYLNSIDIVCESTYVQLVYNTFDAYFNFFTYSDIIYVGDNITDATYNKVMFRVNRQIITHDDNAILFKNFFTGQDNAYVKTYSGYYNLNSNIDGFSNKLAVYGNINFDTSLFLGFSNYGFPYQDVYFYSYDYFSDNYVRKFYEMPFNSGDVTFNNILMTSCKMSVETYNYLSNIGVFSYVRDTTYDDATFNDLLFSIMDSPIYFLSRLLSVELFGVNLFIAFTGLLTMLVLLLLMRKFW